MNYKILGNRVKLYNSHEVSKKDFPRELARIKDLHPTCRLWHRSERSLRLEWASHNLAYKLGINREKTKDCDLNYEQSWYVRFGYFVSGLIAMLFIK